MDQATLHGMMPKVRDPGLLLLALNGVKSAQDTPGGDDSARGSTSPEVDTAKHDKAAHRAQKDVFHDNHHDDRYGQ